MSRDDGDGDDGVFSPFVLDRADGYIGVLVDDLINLGMTASIHCGTYT